MIKNYVICDRCREAKFLYSDERTAHDQLAEACWATEWPSSIVPFGCRYESKLERHVCPKCLTDTERDRIEAFRFERQPF